MVDSAATWSCLWAPPGPSRPPSERGAVLDLGLTVAWAPPRPPPSERGAVLNLGLTAASLTLPVRTSVSPSGVLFCWEPHCLRSRNGPSLATARLWSPRGALLCVRRPASQRDRPVVCMSADADVWVSRRLPIQATLVRAFACSTDSWERGRILEEGRLTCM